MLSLLTDNVSVGIYAFAYRIVEKGLVIRQSISDTLFPEYAMLGSKKTLKYKHLLKHAGFVTVISIPIIIILFFMSDYLVKHFMGVEFISSISVIKVLIFYLLFNYALIPFGVFLQSNHGEKYLIRVTIVKAILNIGCNLLLFIYIGIIGIAISTLINELVSMMLQMYYSKKFMNKIILNDKLSDL